MLAELGGARVALEASKRTEEALAHQALHDGLTGLPNRLLLQDRLTQTIRMAERDGRPFALCVIDLDRFKEVNDTLGHLAGDQLLQAALSTVSAARREKVEAFGVDVGEDRRELVTAQAGVRHSD